MGMTTFALGCRHCGNKAPMDILMEKSLVEEYEDHQDPTFPIEWSAGFIYQVLRCYSCNEVTVYQLAVHTGTDPDYTDRSYDKILYPCEGESPMGLPASIHPSWDAAMRVRKIDPNAFAVLLGRVLDAICAEQQAQGDTLYKRIENLADQGKVPQPLKEVAHKLRNLRNFGAHGNLGDLDPKDAPLLESLCRALLMYLYTVPALTRDAQKRLEKS
jgi:hypothetical protein